MSKPDEAPHDGAQETDQQEPPADREALAAALGTAARRSAFGTVAPGETPTGGALLRAIGGVRGLVESILPGLLFLVVYTFTSDVVLSVLAPVVIAVVFIVIRLIRREPLGSAIAGAIGIAVSAGLALLTGRAEDNFVPGFFINAVLATVMIVSIAVRRPLVGVVVALLTGDREWRRDRAKKRVTFVATLLWAAFPLLRLAVELPLYFTGQTQALATAKLLLGVPLYAAVLWVSWLLVRSAWASTARPDADAAAAR